MSRPTVAIVGRPNVGKSTLFNRILGGRDAIVSDQAGTTRDRHFGEADWGGRRFWLVDTGGLMPGSTDSMDVAVREQVELAVEQSQLVVFVAAATGERTVFWRRDDSLSIDPAEIAPELMQAAADQRGEPR